MQKQWTYFSPLHTKYRSFQAPIAMWESCPWTVSADSQCAKISFSVNIQIQIIFREKTPEARTTRRAGGLSMTQANNFRIWTIVDDPTDIQPRAKLKYSFV